MVVASADFETGDMSQVYPGAGKHVNTWTTGYGTTDVEDLIALFQNAEAIYGSPLAEDRDVALEALKTQINAMQQYPMNEGPYKGSHYARFFGIKDLTWWDGAGRRTSLNLGDGWYDYDGQARARLSWNIGSYSEFWTRIYARFLRLDTTVEFLRFYASYGPDGYYVTRTDIVSPTLRESIGSSKGGCVWSPNPLPRNGGVEVGNIYPGTGDQIWGVIPLQFGRWHEIVKHVRLGTDGLVEVLVDRVVSIRYRGSLITCDGLMNSFQTGIETMGNLGGGDLYARNGEGVVFDLDSIALDSQPIEPDPVTHRRVRVASNSFTRGNLRRVS